MDRYDHLILQIINAHKEKGFSSNIRLADLEREYWKQIENDQALSIGHGRVGERITKLYIEEHIVNRNGYMLTKRGRTVLQDGVNA
jgi:ribosomal protein L18